MDDLNQSLANIHELSARRNHIQLGIAMALGILLLASYLILFSSSLNGSFQRLSDYTLQLKKEKYLPHLNITPKMNSVRLPAI